MPSHNTYFNGNVQSLGFARHGRKQTVGVIEPGEYHFGTDAAERMTVVCGQLLIRIDGQEAWLHYAQGTSFEVPAKSGFSITAAVPTAYWCEFL